MASIKNVMALQKTKTGGRRLQAVTDTASPGASPAGKVVSLSDVEREVAKVREESAATLVVSAAASKKNKLKNKGTEADNGDGGTGAGGDGGEPHASGGGRKHHRSSHREGKSKSPRHGKGSSSEPPTPGGESGSPVSPRESVDGGAVKSVRWESVDGGAGDGDATTMVSWAL